jgi:hypothetical protein
LNAAPAHNVQVPATIIQQPGAHSLQLSSRVQRINNVLMLLTAFFFVIPFHRNSAISLLFR